MRHLVEFRTRTRFPRVKRLHQWVGYNTLLLRLIHGKLGIVLGFVRCGGGRALVPVRVDKLIDGQWVLGYTNEDWRDALKKITVGGSVGGKHAETIADRSSTVLGKLAALVSHCSVVRYEDGSARKPGWFTLSTMGSSWVVKIKDPDACAQLTVTAQSLDDALALADLLVGSSDAPWEPDAFLTSSGPRKKK